MISFIANGGVYQFFFSTKNTQKKRSGLCVSVEKFVLPQVLFQRDSADRTTVDCLLTIAFSALFSDYVRLPVLQLENFGTECFARSTTDTQILIYFWLSHNFVSRSRLNLNY